MRAGLHANCDVEVIVVGSPAAGFDRGWQFEELDIANYRLDIGNVHGRDA
jgi:hypothetical protein